MGDYTKLIVSCQVAVDKEELQNQVTILGLYSSGAHSQEMLESISKSHSKYRKKENMWDLVLVGQTKYGIGQREFLEWLEPYVVQGSGPSDIFAFQLPEHRDSPTTWQKVDKE